MSKSIKVDELVYQELLWLQRPRETFSELIGRLLRIAEMLDKVRPFLETERVRLARKLEEHKTETPAQ